MAKPAFLEGLDELDDLPSSAVALVASPPAAALDLDASIGVRQQSEQEKAQEKLKGIEDELFQESMTIARDMLAFTEIDEDTEANAPPPERWVAELGEEGAARRMRAARAAWKPGKDAPAGAKHATTLAVGIIRARAAEKGAPRALNIAVVQLVEGPMRAYPELEVEK